MATWRRMAILGAVTIAIGITTVIYYRVGQAHLFALAQGQFAGPYSSVITQLATLVPIILAIIEVGVAAWALAGGVQQERARIRGPR